MDAVRAITRQQPVPRSTLVAYSVPMAAFMSAGIPFSIYLMKYSVDVLLLSPAFMGMLVAASRIADAVTDPVAGYLSDRTRSRFGRRRIWMLAAALPIAATILMVWSPPYALEGAALAIWIGVSLILYETVSTAFIVPYAALGMELSDDYRERTRIFAWRHLIGAAGFAVALAFVYLLRTSETPRETAFQLAIVIGVLVIATITWSVSRLREPEEHQGRGGERVIPAFKDVFRNQHARLLFSVYAIESFGSSSITALAPFVMEYVVKAPDMLELLIGAYIVPQFIFTPLWIRLSKRYAKRELWSFGMACMIVAFAGLAFLGEGREWYGVALVFLIGIGSGIASVVAPAVQADVIDYDELQTGERKEGAYTAVWNFIRKAGWGVAAGYTGVLLAWSGYEANSPDQPESVVWMMRFLMGMLPCAAYALGLTLFRRFSLNEREHADVLAALEARRAAQSSGGA